MQEPVIGRGLSRKLQQRIGSPRRKRAPALEKQVHQVGERSTVRWLPIGPEPGCAPQVEYSCVSSEWPIRRLKGRERLFLGSDDSGAFVGLIRQLRSCDRGGPQHGHKITGLEQYAFARALAAFRSADWLTREVGGGCAHQAVAGNETMVEKRQWFVGSERCEPERQAGDLHGRRIEIDTKQAALGYLPAKGNTV